MGLRCVCPNGHALNIKESLAGLRGVCPQCGAPFDIPALTHAGEPPPPAPRPATPAPATNPTTSRPQPQAGSQAPPRPTNPPPPPPEAIEWCAANPAGERFGPADSVVFAEWISQGRVRPEWMVWRTGWPEWKPAASVDTLLPAPLVAAPQAPQPPASPPAPPTPAPPPMGSPPPVGAASVGPAAALARSVAPATEYRVRRMRARRRQRLWVIGLAVVALALVAALVVASMMRSDGAGEPPRGASPGR